MDRGAWRAAVCGVAESQTRLGSLHVHTFQPTSSLIALDRRPVTFPRLHAGQMQAGPHPWVTCQLPVTDTQTHTHPPHAWEIHRRTQTHTHTLPMPGRKALGVEFTPTWERLTASSWRHRDSSQSPPSFRDTLSVCRTSRLRALEASLEQVL